MAADSIGQLSDLVSFEDMVHRLDPNNYEYSLEKDYAYVAEKLRLLREFQTIPEGCDFGVQLNRVALAGFNFKPIDYYMFERHGLSVHWILNANWADAPVIGLHDETLDEFEAFGRPAYLGAFLEHLMAQGYKTELHQDWLPLLEDEFLLGCVRPKKVNGVSYFVTLPLEIVQEHGFVDAIDSPIRGWFAFTGSMRLSDKGATS